MPCIDEMAEEQSRRETVTNLHERTRMLCGLCGAIEANFSLLVRSDLLDKVPGLREWWAQHKKDDEKRLARERQQRKEAIDRKREKLEVVKAELEELLEEEKGDA
jgi:hypothetical protein